MTDSSSDKKPQQARRIVALDSHLQDCYNHAAIFVKPVSDLEVMSFTCDPFEAERTRRKRQQKSPMLAPVKGPRISDLPKPKTRNTFSDSLKNVPIFLIKNKIRELKEKYGIDEHYLFSTEKVLEWDPKCHRDPNDFLDLLLDFEESLERCEKRSRQPPQRGSSRRDPDGRKTTQPPRAASHEAMLAKQLEEEELMKERLLQETEHLKEMEKRRKKNSDELDLQIKKQANEYTTLENLTIKLSKSLDADKVYLITNHSKRSILFVNTKFKDGDVKKKRYTIPSNCHYAHKNNIDI